MTCNAPPAKRPKLDFADTITVRVGLTPDTKLYVIPCKTFAARSDFFKAALSSQWRTSDAPVDLGDVEIDTFESYVHVVFYDEIDIVNVEQWTDIKSVEL
ncbi:hypothetical protein B0A48_00085 [Cryoendolithus antarcticus]|uniref:BTB domain-containing protein n=1 Tax=Cryoendolithus antarcticus TaxID=1507870 RepID=A0A1V8TTP3_9PEZI|nr:hypothetical protein B0A48_00085 [Cryoendolithus antarcticus]